MASEFGWLLFLNRHKKYNIAINAETLNYQTLIVDSEEQVIEIGEGIAYVPFLGTFGMVDELAPRLLAQLKYLGYSVYK